MSPYDVQVLIHVACRCFDKTVQSMLGHSRCLSNNSLFICLCFVAQCMAKICTCMHICIVDAILVLICNVVSYILLDLSFLSIDFLHNISTVYIVRNLSQFSKTYQPSVRISSNQKIHLI